MFKVSFNKDSKNVQTFNDKVTVVTLTGRCTTPDWFYQIPPEIKDWIYTHPSVDIDEMWNKEGNIVMIIKASGKAFCAEEDSFDAAIGERIAESKAKIRLYRFMHTLMVKLYQYYFGLALGDKFSSRHIEMENKEASGGIFDVMSRYLSLLIKESHHLGELLAEA